MQMFKHTCMNTFILSSGAVPVRDTAPAMAPADSCFHHRPLVFSSSVNSSGIERLSPMSSTYRTQHSFISASKRWIKPFPDFFCWPFRDGFLKEEIECSGTGTNRKDKIWMYTKVEFLFLLRSGFCTKTSSCYSRSDQLFHTKTQIRTFWI